VNDCPMSTRSNREKLECIDTIWDLFMGRVTIDEIEAPGSSARGDTTMGA